MPELPEVTTTVNGLKRTILGLFFSDVWTDLAVKNQKVKQFKDTIKDKKFFDKFKKDIIGAKVLKIERRAKNILIFLDNNQIILIHLKMTGHLLFGKYKFDKQNNKWLPDKNERKELHDPYNRFIHVVFSFKDNHSKKTFEKQLVLCDSRKFGKITIIPQKDLGESWHLKNIGPEPLKKSFTFKKFKERLNIKKNRAIKTVLMDQSIIAGIGNIYSDEMLWLSGIHPESRPAQIPEFKLKNLYQEMKEILEKGIKFGGDSMSDYRNIDGKMGNFQNEHYVYQKRNERCEKRNCKGVIIRKVINGRSSHFCNLHQKLF